MTKEGRLQEQILILRHRMGLTVPQFARAVGIPEGTFRDHFRSPSKFRLSEIWALESLGERYGISIQGGEKDAS